MPEEQASYAPESDPPTTPSGQIPRSVTGLLRYLNTQYPLVRWSVHVPWAGEQFPTVTVIRLVYGDDPKEAESLCRLWEGEFGTCALSHVRNGPLVSGEYYRLKVSLSRIENDLPNFRSENRFFQEFPGSLDRGFHYPTQEREYANARPNAQESRR